MSRQTGMTILELLVALTIFALLAAIAYGGLNSILKAGHITSSEAQRLAQLQMTIHLLEKDLLQTVSRSIRSNYTDRLPAMANNMGSTGLEFTRTGYPNPSGLKRSHLLRVRYRLEENTLFRDHWTLIDRPDESTVNTTSLLTGVSEFNVLFHKEGTTKPNWPAAPEELDSLPEAVEIEITLTGWGHIKRLIVLK